MLIIIIIILLLVFAGNAIDIYARARPRRQFIIISISHQIVSNSLVAVPPLIGCSCTSTVCDMDSAAAAAVCGLWCYASVICLCLCLTQCIRFIIYMFTLVYLPQFIFFQIGRL